MNMVAKYIKGCISCTSILGVIYSCLIGLRPAQQKGTLAWYCKPSSLPMAYEIMDSRGKHYYHVYTMECTQWLQTMTY